MCFFLKSICRQSRNGWVGPAWVGRRDLAWISASSSKSFDLLVHLRHNHVFTSKRSGGKSGLENSSLKLWLHYHDSGETDQRKNSPTGSWGWGKQKSSGEFLITWQYSNLCVLQNHRKSTITPSWKIPLFQHFAREKTYYVAKIFRRAPLPPLNFRHCPFEMR